MRSTGPLARIRSPRPLTASVRPKQTQCATAH